MIPKFYDNFCLTNTSNCVSMDIYYYKNTFLARENMSQIYFWYDGNRIYIYGISPETCQQPTQEITYMPVNIFQISKTDNIITFTPFPNECVTALTTILDYYTNTLKVQKQKIYLHKFNQDSYITNIFDIIKSMIDNNVFAL